MLVHQRRTPQGIARSFSIASGALVKKKSGDCAFSPSAYQAARQPPPPLPGFEMITWRCYGKRPIWSIFHPSDVL